MESSNQSEASNGKPPRKVTASDMELIDAGFRYAYSLTHHRQDAEDLVQQACLQVFRRRGSLVTKGYFFVAIRNIFRDGCRRQSLVSFEGLPDGSVMTNVNEDVQSSAAKLDLEFILATLQSFERELLYLHHIEGFTTREISEMTKQPRGTVLSRLARIKQRLANRFVGEVSEGK